MANASRSRSKMVAVLAPQRIAGMLLLVEMELEVVGLLVRNATTKIGMMVLALRSRIVLVVLACPRAIADTMLLARLVVLLAWY